MELKPVLCTCSKRFKTKDAMLQHRRDSPRHIDTPQVSQQTPSLHELVQRLLLQDDEADHGFIPFSGGGPTTFSDRNPSLRVSSWSETAAPSLVPEQVTAGEIDVAKGMKKKKKKTDKRNILMMGRGGDSTWNVNPNTGQMMNLLEDQDWALCDKDCGWCGHCTDGVWY